MTEPAIVTVPSTPIAKSVQEVNAAKSWVVNEIEDLELEVASAWTVKAARVAVVVAFCVGLAVGCVF
jgi:hypothetical protein